MPARVLVVLATTLLATLAVLVFLVFQALSEGTSTATGSDLVTVPQVAGQAETDALRIIQRADLTAITRGEASDEVEWDTAEDGEQAWNLLEQAPERYNAVLLDRMMPRMDGYEVASHVRNDARVADVPAAAIVVHSL